MLLLYRIIFTIIQCFTTLCCLKCYNLEWSHWFKYLAFFRNWVLDLLRKHFVMHFKGRRSSANPALFIFSTCPPFLLPLHYNNLTVQNMNSKSNSFCRLPPWRGVSWYFRNGKAKILVEYNRVEYTTSNHSSWVISLS